MANESQAIRGASSLANGTNGSLGRDLDGDILDDNATPTDTSEDGDLESLSPSLLSSLLEGRNQTNSDSNPNSNPDSNSNSNPKPNSNSNPNPVCWHLYSQVLTKASTHDLHNPRLMLRRLYRSFG